jgi:hypothetical protein
VVARARWLLIALFAVTLPASARGDEGVDVAHGLSLRLATSAAYVRESWSPNDGNPGAVKTGWAPVVEIAVGRALSRDVAVGGILQLTPLFAPSESFAGNSYELTDEVDLVVFAGAFVEDPRLPVIPVRAGIAVGAVTSLLLDQAQDQLQSRLGIGISPYVGYDRRVSGRWRAGLLARTTLFRNVAGDAPPSATAGGLITSLLVTFTFR